MINYDLISEEISTADKLLDPGRYVKTLGYAGFLSLNAAANYMWSNESILADHTTRKSEYIRRIINNAGPLAYKILDLYDAIRDEDDPNIAILAGEVFEDLRALYGECYPEDGMLTDDEVLLRTLTFNMLRDCLSDPDLSANTITDPKGSYEKYAPLFLSLMSSTDAALEAQILGYIDDWADDISIHSIPDFEKTLLTEEEFKSLSDGEMKEYAERIFVQSVLSGFDTIFTNRLYPVVGDYSGRLRCTLDHAIQVKESFNTYLDVVESYGSKESFTTQAAVNFYVSVKTFVQDCAEQIIDGIEKTNRDLLRMAIEGPGWDMDICTKSTFFEMTRNGNNRYITFTNDTYFGYGDCYTADWGEDATQTAILISSGKSVVLDLNGYTVYFNATPASLRDEFVVEGKLEIRKGATYKLPSDIVVSEGGILQFDSLNFNGKKIVLASGGSIVSPMRFESYASSVEMADDYGNADYFEVQDGSGLWHCRIADAGKTCSFRGEFTISEHPDFIGANDVKLLLNRRDVGYYNIEASYDANGKRLGWTIQVADAEVYLGSILGTAENINPNTGKYLALKNGKLEYNDTPFIWDYRDGGFCADETIEHTSLGYTLFGKYIEPSTVKKTRTYYLSAKDAGASLSQIFVLASLRLDKQDAAHVWTAWKRLGNGSHARYCPNCARVEVCECEYVHDGRCVCGQYDHSRVYTLVDSEDYSLRDLAGNTHTYYLTKFGASTGISGLRYTVLAYSLNGGRLWILGNTAITANHITNGDVMLKVLDNEGNIFNVMRRDD